MLSSVRESLKLASSIALTSGLMIGLAGVGSAQPSAPAQLLTGGFASPWTIRFEHIHAAMSGKFGASMIEQIRRERDESGNWVGTLERQLYRPADLPSQTPERFRLEFRGLENRSLGPAEFTRLETAFQSRAGFTFRYKGFRVADPVRAAGAYKIVFLAKVTRRISQGLQDVYRVAVVPHGWDRTAWLLELDVRTGYPLYAAAYIRDQNHGLHLASELIVTSILHGVRVPHAASPIWWKPLHKVQGVPSANAALRAALTQSRNVVEPTNAELPNGFVLNRSEVLTDPYSGEKRAMLIYSDGVDRMFVVQNNIPVQARGSDDTILYLTEGEFTQCLFSHGGVQFRVVGRAGGDAVRESSAALFDRAIREL